MKFLAINGSPHGSHGNTEVILQAFLEGVNEAGGQSEIIYLKEKEIRHCTGCFNCWMKTPGVCSQKDDMQAIIEKLLRAEFVIYATPLYIFTVSGLMKDFMDRLIPLLNPKIVIHEGHYIHPPRFVKKGGVKSIIISNAGYPEICHFSGLKETFRLFTQGPEDELAGTIFCAGGPMLRVPVIKYEVAWYLDATRKAGHEVVTEGRITRDTQKVLNRPLFPDPAVYMDMVNKYFSGYEKKEEERYKVGLPAGTARGNGRPLSHVEYLETVRNLIAKMPLSFKKEKANGLSAVIQFTITDEKPGHYYLSINEGKCKAYEGRYPAPSLAIHTPSDVWLKISRGEINGADAMIDGRYRVSGDMDLLMKMGKLFASPKGVKRSLATIHRN